MINPTLEDKLRGALMSFMIEMEKFSSEIEGTPSPKQLHVLNDIYDKYVESIKLITKE